MINNWGLRNWIYHNSTDWLLTIIYNEVKYTLSDKNLWATTVWNRWDWLNSNNAWLLYQWGNNYWFNQIDWSFNTDPSQVDTTWYWPWNYYNDSTFRSWSYTDWSNPSNGNLWWWATLTFEAMQWPCPSWFHIPHYSDYYTIYQVLASLTEWNTEFWIHLMMPPAWFISNWSVQRVWTEWHYWTVTDATTEIWAAAWSLYTFWSNWSGVTTFSARKFWYSIRPFKNTVVLPDDIYWTKIL